MSNEFGNDIIGLVDEEGNEASYEMIDALEKDGVTYVALLPYCEDPEEQLDEDYQVMILKMVWKHWLMPLNQNGIQKV